MHVRPQQSMAGFVRTLYDDMNGMVAADSQVLYPNPSLRTKAVVIV
jgi:hypothetical protein